MSLDDTEALSTHLRILHACLEPKPFLEAVGVFMLGGAETLDWTALLAPFGFSPEDAVFALDLDQDPGRLQEHLARMGQFRSGFEGPRRLVIGRQDATCLQPRTSSIHALRPLVIRGDLGGWRPRWIRGARSIAFLDTQGPLEVEGELAAPHLRFFPDLSVSASRVSGSILRSFEGWRFLAYVAAPGTTGWTQGAFDQGAYDPAGFVDLSGPWDPRSLRLDPSPNLLILHDLRARRLRFPKGGDSNLQVLECLWLREIRLPKTWVCPDLNAHLAPPPLAPQVHRAGLRIERCRSLERLGPALEIRGELCIRDCASLRFLPDPLKVVGNLRLEQLAAIEELPSSLDVQGSFVILGCPRLASLPSGLSVQGDLVLEGLEALRQLPMATQVRGQIRVTRCAGLRVQT